MSILKLNRIHGVQNNIIILNISYNDSNYHFVCSNQVLLTHFCVNLWENSKESINLWENSKESCILFHFTKDKASPLLIPDLPRILVESPLKSQECCFTLCRSISISYINITKIYNIERQPICTYSIIPSNFTRMILNLARRKLHIAKNCLFSSEIKLSKKWVYWLWVFADIYELMREKVNWYWYL